LSLHKYITAFRIGKATDLLCGSVLSIQEIAGLCGFVNANHFSVCFKKMTGTSPLALRKGVK
ncbi:MAG: helix-turn-helix transcriptional regulator, partial [Clostridia bacterium]|nr:helix-turn-helix transcriptional regulator [Clostridia bacterium]